MSGADVVISGMCAGMILLGVVVFRRSRRDRAMGAITVVLGLVGLVAYLGAEEGAPPRDATPATSPITTPVSNAIGTAVGTPPDRLSSSAGTPVG